MDEDINEDSLSVVAYQNWSWQLFMGFFSLGLVLYLA
jgi:hypothetical protein